VYPAISNAEDRYCGAIVKKNLQLSIHEVHEDGVEYMFYLYALDRISRGFKEDGETEELEDVTARAEYIPQVRPFCPAISS
jgi:hypothetical protein